MSAPMFGLPSAYGRFALLQHMPKTILSVLCRTVMPACALLLCAACGKLLGSAVPPDVLATCVATSTGQVTIPSDHTVGDLLTFFKDRGEIAWEPSSGRSGIIRMVRVDPLNGKRTTIALELTELPADPNKPACTSGMSLIDRMDADGNVVTGIEAQMLILGLLSKAPKAAEAATAPEPMRIPPANDAPPPVAAANDQLIDGCYHLESCGYSRVLNVETVRTEGGERLLKATVEHGTVSNPSGAPDDRQRINWSGSPSTLYAFCSTRLPAVISSDGGPYMAEEFDFAGSGISGVQQNNANIYQALCHGIYDNSLAGMAASLGYQPLAEEGGRGQFIVASPEALFVAR